MKTGDTNSAGKCFIAAASRGGVTLIAVLLGGTLDDTEYRAKSDNMNAKAKDPYNAKRFQDAIKVFDYGFKQMAEQVSVQQLIDMGMPAYFTVEVKNAAKNDPENGMLIVEPKLDFNQKLQIMKPYMDQLAGSASAMADPKIGTLVAPINAGDLVGTVDYKIGDNILLSSNLYAKRSVKEGILSDATVQPAAQADQPSASAGVSLMGSASTLSGEPVKESNAKRIILIVVIVLLVLVVLAFAAFLIVARIRRERRRKARAAARRRKKLQQQRIARQRAAEQDRL